MWKIDGTKAVSVKINKRGTSIYKVIFGRVHKKKSPMFGLKMAQVEKLKNSSQDE